MESAAFTGFSPLMSQEHVPTQIISNIHTQNAEAAGKILEALASNPIQAILKFCMRGCDEIIAELAGQDGVSAEAFHHVRIQQAGIKSYLKGLLANGDEYDKGTHPIAKAAQSEEVETPLA